MKLLTKIATAILLAGLSVVVAANPATAAPTTLAADNSQQIQTFAIDKMTCAACPITVHKAMSKVAGVKSVDVNFDAKTATVAFDPAVVTVDEIARSSTNAGYPAAVAEDG